MEDKPAVTWININGVHQLENIEKIGKKFKIHPLVLEDIMHTGQRPKMEDFEGFLFIVLKMFQYNQNETETKTEQISLIVGSNTSYHFKRMKEMFLILSEKE